MDVINGGLENIRKWYHKIDDTNVYFICLGQYRYWSVKQ